MVRFFFFKTT